MTVLFFTVSGFNKKKEHKKTFTIIFNIIIIIIICVCTL